ncbi:hypothetical protein [Psychroserpens ponticola]|uniref:SRPBCC family protein n=1 Tax=Psychroserpens ponticola TaxID=2932268 RepID=A0ABY7S0U2_9FLAO|nr:hypothetical protein [Psychroserpens ponticola]WCO03010.1 hypothetical protein MUN68_005835 [Psychroserpens ponticola]
MRVINSHKRKLNQPIKKVSELFKTLATKNDKIWPSNNWPAMRFKDGLSLGSQGGHGRIRYTIIAFEAGKHIKFKFTKPEGFNGTHELNIITISDHTSEINHIIKMKTNFKATFLWVFIIRWLHDALIEEAFDTVENYFSEEKKVPKYNFWVNYLRGFYKRKSFQAKQA